ncbi:MAG: phosphopeptide-binding protein [Pseudanabaena sp.]|nr:MAG: phosphopeptide-binding protein [Pseudanabaena sp.]
MIICPSCAHANPDGAVNCEACFSVLPVVSTIQCPNCQSDVRSDAKFCGHCGFNLSSAVGHALSKIADEGLDISSESVGNNLMSEVSISQTASVTNPSIHPTSNAMSNTVPNETSSDDSGLVINSISEFPTIPKFTDIEKILAEDGGEAPVSTPINNIFEPELGNENSYEKATPINAKTQLQQLAASLLHVQTNLNIEIPAHLSVVHIGKPNTVIPPDIDVSGFPDSDIVSRIHADIRTEGGFFYFEDTGSSNGTYINNLPLSAGNRHKLRAGDRISLGKGDKVSFIFQLNN